MITIEEFKKKQSETCRLIGLDLGSKRIGVSICDEKQSIATPLKTLNKTNTDNLISELKMIIEALLQSVKRVFYVSLLLFIILYIYSTIGSILFSEDIPSRWGNVGTAMITLFQVLTLSSWEQVMLPIQDIYWWAWIYFFSFIIICGITKLNLLIAILVDVVINQKKL